MVDLWAWMIEIVQQYGYLGAFMVSVIGNISIFLPVPFVLVIYFFGSTLDPILLGLFGGLGSTVGEFIAYLIGRGGRKVIESRYGDRLEGVNRIIGRYGMLAIFLFALLPVPDDLILIPLGMIKYNPWKVLISMFFGKTIMCIVVAYAGLYSLSIVKDVFESGGIWSGVISIILLILVIILLLKIDWVKIADRLEKRHN